MKTIEFQSATRGNIAYRFCDEWQWDARGNLPLSIRLMEYETYGDGLTQHSGAYCTQFCYLTDACISLAQAIVADPKNEAWEALGNVFCHPREDTINFALSIKYREDKDQWFDLANHKVSTSERYKHDRRWEKVENWMDGTAKSAFSIINTRLGGYDTLGKLCWLDELRMKYGCASEDVWEALGQVEGDWLQAFHAARDASLAVQYLRGAARTADCALGNTKRSRAEQSNTVAA